MPDCGMPEMTVKSMLDGGQEKCLFHWPEGGGERPLLVGLHTWSCNRFNQVNDMLPSCKERGWGLLLPEFRGPNLVTNPRSREACASRLAMQDIIDAVEHVSRNYPVKRDSIMLLGGSGGGHMSLMMAAYAPALWRIVSSWVPITDLAAWHKQNSSYAPHIVACCGGAPGSSDEVDRHYGERSPIRHIEALRQARVHVHHGRFDTSVPYTHTLKLAQEMEKGNCERFFFEIFDGSHELRIDDAFRELDRELAAAGARQQLSK